MHTLPTPVTAYRQSFTKHSTLLQAAWVVKRTDLQSLPLRGLVSLRKDVNNGCQTRPDEMGEETKVAESTFVWDSQGVWEPTCFSSWLWDQ